jgi:transcriptional regulator with XRE-family HTH domain
MQPDGLLYDENKKTEVKNMNIDIANRLYELRKKNSFSQEELAEKIGVSRQAVSKWERAEASPDTDNLILLSKLYNLSMDELLSTEENVEPIVRQPVSVKEEKYEEEELSGNFWVRFPYPIFVTIIYFLLGYSFNLWHPGWLLFVTIPIYYSVVGVTGRRHRRR